MWQAGWHFTQWQHIARLILALSLLVSCLCSRFPSRSSAVFLFHVIFLLNFLFFFTSSIFFSFLLYPFMSLLCNLRGGFSSLSLSFPYLVILLHSPLLVTLVLKSLCHFNSLRGFAQWVILGVYVCIYLLLPHRCVGAVCILYHPLIWIIQIFNLVHRFSVIQYSKHLQL